MSYVLYFFFFKQKTAYEMRISDWSSDVCSSDLLPLGNLVSLPRVDSDHAARHRRNERAVGGRALPCPAAHAGQREGEGLAFRENQHGIAVRGGDAGQLPVVADLDRSRLAAVPQRPDRKSTRLNSSH